MPSCCLKTSNNERQFNNVVFQERASCFLKSQSVLRCIECVFYVCYWCLIPADIVQLSEKSSCSLIKHWLTGIRISSSWEDEFRDHPHRTSRENLQLNIEYK